MTRVTAEQAAEVFRRAADLETAPHPGGEALLDEAALIDIGGEVGLSPESIHVALAELSDRPTAGKVDGVWGTVSSSRTVLGSATDLVAALDDEARRNRLAVVQRRGDVTTWSPSPGASAALARTLRGRRRYPMLAFRELRATTEHLPSRPGVTRIRLDASLISPLRLMSARGRVESIAGIVGGLLLARQLRVGPSEQWVPDAIGALSAATGTGLGLRSYRTTVATAEAALDGLLDRLSPPAPDARPTTGGPLD